MRTDSNGVRRREALTRVRTLCRSGEGEAGSLLVRAGEQVNRAVPYDRLAWQLYHPDAMVPITAGSTVAVSLEERLAFCELEQRGGDAIPFRALARARVPVATLEAGTNGVPATSRRYRELLAPAGFRHGLRAALVHQGRCWGALVLLRGSGPGFSTAEIRWLAATSKELASGLKQRLVRGARTHGAPDPGVVMLAPGRAPQALTASARLWLDLLGQPPWGTERVEIALNTAAVRARVQGPSHPVRVCLPSAAGWAAVHASAEERGDQVTMVIDSARPKQLLPLLASAYGLTSAEQAVVGLLMQGLPSKAIARELRITTDTVGDHLKAAYYKTDTHGRGELQHRLALDAWTAWGGAGTAGKP